MTPNAGGLPAGFRIVCDDDMLRITHARGTAPRHIVSFTGVGHGLNGVQAEEFRRSLDSLTVADATYVIDKRRSWFNVTEARIVDHLTALCAGSPRTITLGNSMGGFGAFYFASALPHCRRAIAFVPQFSVNPEYMPPSEGRWLEHRRGILHHRITHALQHASDDVDYIAFFGANDRLDMQHAQLILRNGTRRTWVYLLDGHTHDVVTAIKRAGCLPKLLGLLTSEEGFEPDRILQFLRMHNLQVTLGMPHGALAT